MLYFYTKHMNDAIVFVCLYYVIDIFLLFLTFYFKSLNKWALHGKNLFLKIEKDEERYNTKIYKFKSIFDNFIISKTYFSHFYIIGLLINSIIVFQDFQYNLKNQQNVYYHICLTNLVFEIHLLRRFCEQLFLVRTSTKSFMHISSYLLGISFYIITPFSLYNNEKINYNWSIIFPLLLFIFGNIIQFESHLRLARLRPKGIKKSDAFYKVPYGGFFYFVSCPHYFAEILIYFSFFLLNKNITCSLNFLLVSLILIKNGMQTHEWYLKVLADTYPKNRKIIFPYIF
ncbi:polyprenol reductase, putative [Plasmodium sp. DRC-Itaito]|nr:polyprenol reductase, putative [Plasmodium sp. DRC-Itaito]